MEVQLAGALGVCAEACCFASCSSCLGFAFAQASHRYIIAKYPSRLVVKLQSVYISLPISLLAVAILNKRRFK